MAGLELRDLHQLHEIDLAILEIRKRAGALDPGRAIQAHIQGLQNEGAKVLDAYKALHAEQTDLELKVKGIDEKLAKVDKEMYGGSVVNSREIANLEKEIFNLKASKDAIETRELELMDLIPPAKTQADRYQNAIDAKKKELVEHQKQVLVEKERLERDYKEVSAKRAPAAAKIPANLLAKYDAIRLKHGGIGMTDVTGGRCGMCGTALPERLIQGAREGRAVACEACHRLLYYTDGLI